MNKDYDIIRFYKTSDRKRLMFEGVTEEQAKEWCNDPLTRKEGVYFDGFAKTGSFSMKRKKAYYSSYFSPTSEYH